MQKKEISKSLVVNAKKNCWSSGAESYILKKDKSLYKIFRTKNYSELLRKVNKLRIIEQQQLEFLVHPISLLTCDGIFVGYEMDYDEEDILWEDCKLNRNQEIVLLQELKDKLLRLEDCGIIYSDIKANNLLINKNTKRVKLCDVDNIATKEYGFDKLRLCLKEIRELKNIDIHSFMHNMYTLERLEGYKEFFDIRKCKDDISDTYTPEGVEIFENMKKAYVTKELKRGYLIDKLK